MKIVKELIPYVIILVVVVAVRTFIVTPIVVDGDSMVPTLNDGEMMILYKLGKVDRNDIVVVNNEEGYIIKRVIGLPGDSVRMEDGVMYINDEEVEDKFASDTEDFDKVYLESDEYFVLGDNREISLDSRSFGAIREDEIMGTTNFMIYPFSKFGTVED